LLRQADLIFLEEIRNAGLYDGHLSGLRRPAVVAYGGCDGRRPHLKRTSTRCAVVSLEGGFFHFDMQFLGRVAILGINRNVTSTPKPPRRCAA